MNAGSLSGTPCCGFTNELYKNILNVQYIGEVAS